MANGTNAPFGIKPVKFLSGATWNGQVNTYLINPATTESFYKNDLVAWVAQNTTYEYAANTPATDAGYLRRGGYRVGTTWAATPALILPAVGSFQKVTYTDINGIIQVNNQWIAGTSVYPNTQIVAEVADDPALIYQVQVSNSAAAAPGGTPPQLTTLTQNRIGSYAINAGTTTPFAAPLTLSWGSAQNGNPTTAGNSYSHISNAYLDLNAAAITANTFPVRFLCLRLAEFPQNFIGTVANDANLFNIAEVIMIDHNAKVVPPITGTEAN